MGYLFLLLLYIMLGLALLSVGFYVALAVLVAAGATGLVAGLGEFASSGVKGFGGRGSLDNIGIRPTPGGEPAYRSYFQGPVIREFGLVVSESSQSVIRRLRQWISWTWRRLGQFDNWLWKALVILPILAAIGGLVVGGCLAAVVLAAATLVAGVLLALLVLVGRLVGLVLRGIELGVLAIRGITLECPECRNRVAAPIYRCSGLGGCDAAHQRLVPGSYGILFRVCQCGRSLPTLLLLGKLRLVGQCSHCKAQLPGRGYSAPTLHIPVAGAPQVGKSVFMFAGVKRLYDGVGGDDTQHHFWADEKFLQTFVETIESIRKPELMRKTAVGRPNAYNIYLGKGRRRRLLYLYDTGGEIYEDSGTLSEADFYRFTKGIVLCIDPFSLAGLRRRVDRSTLDDVRSLSSNPKDVLERMTENLREWGLGGKRGGRLSTKVAVVVTKADALAAAQVPHPYATLSPLNGNGSGRAERDAAVRSWIGDVGVRADLVSSITNNFATTSFFVVSHADAGTNDPHPQRGLNDDPADPIQWILNRGAFT
jgi:Double-GTPase 2